MTLEIKSKVSKQGLRAGKTLYYAYPTKREKLSIDQVMEQISSICSLSRIDVESALRAFSEVDADALLEARTYDLGEGTQSGLYIDAGERANTADLLHHLVDA